MATAPNTVAAEGAPQSNVVRLPTASRRIVRQPCNRAGREARNALRKAQPWPGTYISPGVRAQFADATLIDKTPINVALVIAMAAYSGLNEPGKEIARIEMATRGLHHEAGRAALALVKRRTKGDLNDLYRALELIRGEGRDAD